MCIAIASACADMRVALLSVLCALVAAQSSSGYLRQRAALVHAEELMAVGGAPHRTHRNDTLVAALLERLRRATDISLVTRNMRDVQSAVDASPLYRLLLSMPKGAVLHAHSFVDARALVAVATYRTDCWSIPQRDVLRSAAMARLPARALSTPWRRVRPAAMPLPTMRSCGP